MGSIMGIIWKMSKINNIMNNIKAMVAKWCLNSYNMPYEELEEYTKNMSNPLSSKYNFYKIKIKQQLFSMYIHPAQIIFKIYNFRKKQGKITLKRFGDFCML